jgi:DNA-binding transcriptional ArsR family regulator
LTESRADSIINELVNNQAQLTAVFAALADPTRRRLLTRLSGRGAKPVAALAKPFRISPPAISRHLRVLEKARLIERSRQGREHLIRARPDGMRKAQEWMSHCAAAWQFSFDTLENLIEKQLRKDKKTCTSPR